MTFLNKSIYIFLYSNDIIESKHDIWRGIIYGTGTVGAVVAATITMRTVSTVFSTIHIKDNLSNAKQLTHYEKGIVILTCE